MRRAITLLITISGFVVPAFPAAGQSTYDANGTTTGWLLPFAWNLSSGPGNVDGVPGQFDTARLNSGQTYALSYFGSGTIGAIEWSDTGATVDILAGTGLSASMTVDNDMDVVGTLNLTSDFDGVWSTLIRAGRVTNAATGVMNMGGTSTSASTWRQLQVDDFVNNGTVNVDQQSRFNRSSAVFTNHANVNVASGASLTFGSANTFNQDGGTFDNQGTFRLDADRLNFKRR